jgi:signal transduction histidine kinase
MLAGRQDLDMASRQVYARLRRRELLARLDFGIRLGLVLVPLGALSNVLFLSDRLPQRLAGFGAFFVLMLSTLLVRGRPWVQRHTEAFVIGYMSCVTATLLFLLSNSPEDLPVLVAPVSSVVVAAPLMYPWSPRSQVILAIVTTLAFALMVGMVAPPGGGVDAGFNFAMALITMSTLSVVVAWLLERHRFAAFLERRRVRALATQRRRLMEIGRELRSTLDIEILLPRLISHARHVLPADWGTIAIRESGADVFRIGAASGIPGVEDLIGLQWAPEFTKELLAAFPPRELHALPGSPLDALVLPTVRSYGAKSMILAAVGSPQHPLAFFTWVRSDGRAFTRSERRAALEMADQAHTALSAADLYGKALEASRLKSEFVSTISHEFRTPLSVIVGYAEMARDPELSLAERVRSLEGIEVSARELLLLVEQTLDIGRIEAGRSPVQPERIRLATFWLAMQEMCGLLPRKPTVRLLWNDTVPDFAIRSDRRRLAIMIRNLVGNALKFTESGTVEAHLAVDGKDLLIDVKDTGIGIRPEDRESIFEIFRQADGSETRRYDGTGLGLYIVSEFARQLGGAVEVWSEPEKGSRFTVRIPCGEHVELREGTSAMPPVVTPLAAMAASATT